MKTWTSNLIPTQTIPIRRAKHKTAVGYVVTNWKERKMGKWTHNICTDCWGKANPNRKATAIIAAERDRCCFCGTWNSAGIYVRFSPNRLRCKGDHREFKREA
jgi:hypothetical protein